MDKHASLALLLVLLTAAPGLAGRPEPGEFTAELNGLKHWYKVSGKGPVCLMPSPPWGVSSDLYFRTLKPMERYFTVVYLDSRGCGRSDKPKTTKEYTWDLLADDLEALRVHLQQDKVWLMGHSEGGNEVVHYACRRPEQVAGLILFASSAAVGPADDLAAFARAMKRKDEPWFPEVFKLIVSGPPKTDADMAAGMEKMLPAYWAKPERIEKFKADFAAATMSAAAAAARQDSGRMHFDLTQQLAKVTSPALIVVGDRDDACPPYMSRDLHLGLSRSKLFVLEDCGHFPWLEQAKEFEAQLPKFMQAIGVPE